MKSVLITGCSTGIGAATAQRLARKGWRVYAGVREQGQAPEGTEEVLLDVTDADAVASLSSIEHLDGLVNNAGIAVASPLESLPVDELRRQLDVNVVGQLAVLQACLPALRNANQGQAPSVPDPRDQGQAPAMAKGARVVFVGSIAGKSALPFLGAYAMSKFALEAMADSLRLELAPEGMHVSIVEPGTIATPIWSKPQPLADELPERYRARVTRFREVAASRASKAAPVELVAEAIEHALTAERPRTRYLVGRDARIRAQIERLPDRLRDRVLAKALLGG